MKYKGFLAPFVFIILFTLVYITYGGLFQTFFQQDEWLTMGNTFVNGIFGQLSHSTFLQLLGGAERPLGTTLNNIAYRYFPFRTDVLVWFALTVHALNAYVWFCIVIRLTGKRSIALASSIFFACAYVSSQSVTWFASIFTTLPSTTFIFLSILMYLVYRTKRRIKYIFYAQIASIIAFLFKESSVFIFFLIPAAFLWEKRKHIRTRQTLVYFSPVLTYLIFVLITRIQLMFLLKNEGASFISQSSSMWERLIFHLFFYPLLSSVQIFIPQAYMFSFAKYFLRINYGSIHGFTETQLGLETIVSDFVSFILFAGLFVVFRQMYVHRKRWGNVLLFGLTYVLTSFLPFIILNKGNAYLDSRYYYNGAAGAGLLLAVTMYILYEWTRKYQKYIRIITGIVVCLLFSVYMVKNIQLVRRDIRGAISVSRERRQLLFSMKKYFPVLPHNAVVYVSGNSAGYYNVPELKVPLQQGPGYTIMTWYFNTGSIPGKLLQEDFLWSIKSQGYRAEQGNGFGYFWDKKELIAAIGENSLTPEQVVGFYYDDENKKLVNITDQLRTELLPYF